MSGSSSSSSIRRRRSKGLEYKEANILAIVDTSGPHHTKDANEDRIAFIEAVRAVSIVSDNGTLPTDKMFQEVFKILRTGKTLELIVASYQLLDELEKRFPRVYLSNEDALRSGAEAAPELVVVKEDWSAFVVTPEFPSFQRDDGKVAGGSIDSYGFHLLIQDLVDLIDEANFQNSDIECLRNLLLFQYLVNVLENDFVPRNTTYEGTSDWTVLKESLLNMLLGSRKINYKSLVKDCLTIMCRLYKISATFSDDVTHKESNMEEQAKNSDSAVSIALLEVGRTACIAMQKFFTMVMELDASKKKADLKGSTVRSDGIRTPIVELILDELTYNNVILHHFLQVYNEPKWKLEIVIQYLWKYVAKPAVRTRRSNGSPDGPLTFRGALNCLSNTATARSTIKKIGAEEIQLLLVHGFEAYLTSPSKLLDESISNASGQSTRYSEMELCKDMISAVKCLKEVDKNMVIPSFGKEALFVAASIISMKP